MSLEGQNSPWLRITCLDFRRMGRSFLGLGGSRVVGSTSRKELVKRHWKGFGEHSIFGTWQVFEFCGSLAGNKAWWVGTVQILKGPEGHVRILDLTLIWTGGVVCRDRLRSCWWARGMERRLGLLPYAGAEDRGLNPVSSVKVRGKGGSWANSGFCPHAPPEVRSGGREK